MLIPEVILYKFVKSCLQYTREDYYLNLPPAEAYAMLYKLFYLDDNIENLKFESYNYYDQSVDLFTRTFEHPRKLDIFFGYNAERANIPTIHLLLPNENRGRYDSISDQSENNNVYNLTRSTVQVKKAITHQSTYSFMITSDNSSEVYLIYYWLRAMVVIFKEHLEIKGLHNIKTSGADLVLQQEFAPPNIFHRNLNLEFDYSSEYNIDIITDMSNKFNLFVCSDIGDEYQRYMDNLKNTL